MLVLKAEHKLEFLASAQVGLKLHAVIQLHFCRGWSRVSLCPTVPEADSVPVGAQSLEVLLVIDPLFASRALGHTFSSCNDTWHPAWTHGADGETFHKPSRQRGVCVCVCMRCYLLFLCEAWFIIKLKHNKQLLPLPAVTDEAAKLTTLVNKTLLEHKIVTQNFFEHFNTVLLFEENRNTQWCKTIWTAVVNRCLLQLFQIITFFFALLINCFY